MPDTYFDSELTGSQIEATLAAIHGVISPSNNGKVLAIENGAIVPKSASEWTDTAVLEPLSVTANGDYTPGDGVDGFNSVHVDVSGGGGGSTLITKTITENGTYNASDESADGYSQVIVNVSGGDVEPSLPAEYQEVEYMDFDGNSFVTINSQYIQEGDIYETYAQYTNALTTEQCLLASNVISRFELYFGASKANIWIASSSTIIRGVIDSLVRYETEVDKAVSLNDKCFFLIQFYKYPYLSEYLLIGAYGSTNSYRFNSRLFKIKHSRESFVPGDSAQGTFSTQDRRVFSWYKPCYRKADNVPGWYDTRTDTFFTNEGTGTFTVGPDVN